MRVRTWASRAGTVGVVVVSVVWLQGRFAPDSVVLPDRETRTSSSGRYTSGFLAEEINGRRNVYPVIKSSAGEVLWSDDRCYPMSAYPVGVVWQKDADVLWLLSNDTGTLCVVEKDGEWVKEQDWDTLPPDIEEIERG